MEAGAEASWTLLHAILFFFDKLLFFSDKAIRSYIFMITYTEAGIEIIMLTSVPHSYGSKRYQNLLHCNKTIISILHLRNCL